MGARQVVFRFNVDEAKAVEAFTRLRDGMGGVENASERTAKALDAVRAAAQRAGAEAKRDAQQRQALGDGLAQAAIAAERKAHQQRQALGDGLAQAAIAAERKAHQQRQALGAALYQATMAQEHKAQQQRQALGDGLAQAAIAAEHKAQQQRQQESIAQARAEFETRKTLWNEAARVQREKDREVAQSKRALERETEMARGSSRATWSAGLNAAPDGAGARAVGSLTSMLSGAFGVGAGAAVFGRLLSSIEQMRQAFTQFADRREGQQRGLRDLVSLLPGDAQSQGQLRSFLGLGAAMGVAPAQSAEIINPLVSLVNKNGGGLDEREQAELLERLRSSFAITATGATAFDAGEIEGMGAAKGMAPGRAIDLVAMAAGMSARTTGEFARYARSAGEFSSLEAGLAAQVAISPNESPTRMFEISRALGRMLGTRSDDSEFSKAFKLRGLSSDEKVEQLVAAYAATPKKFSTTALAGLGVDQTESDALMKLIGGADLFRSTFSAMRGAEPGEIFRRFATVTQSPMTAEAFTTDAKMAADSLALLFGPMGSQAAETKAIQQARGSSLLRSGVPFLQRLVDPETGMATGGLTNFAFDFAAGIIPGDQGAAEAASVPALSQRTVADVVGGQASLDAMLGPLAETMKDLRVAIDKNTEATAKNTAGGRPLADRNAQE